MRFAITNHILDATLSATNASSNYPVTNIQHQFLSKRFQSGTTSSVITATWAADITCDCLFYAFHNLIALSAVFKNSGGGTLATVTPSTLYDVGVEYFTQLTTVRSVEITITASTYAYIGGICIAEYYDMPYPSIEQPRNLEDNSSWEQSLSGESLSNYEEPLEIREFRFPGLSLSEANGIRTLYKTIGKGTPFYADFYPDTRDFMEPLYCCFSDVLDDTIDGNHVIIRNVTLYMRECR